MDVTKIGNKIRERRTQLNMTQKELAQLLNISNQLVSKWETGESLPSLEYLDSLCSALQVDFTFFTKDDGEPTPATPAEQQPETQDKKRKRKINAQLIGAVCCCLWVALFITGLILLICLVFVPSANKTPSEGKNPPAFNTGYIKEMDDSLENYFSRGYYDITRKLQVDGDDKDDVIYRGIIDENGNIAYYDSEKKATYADGVLTLDYSDDKYRAELPEHIKTLDDLVKWQIFDDKEDSDFDLKYITDIRRTGNGFYIEMSEEYLLHDMEGSVKKNIQFLDKIKGETVIKDGVFVSMSVTVKYRNIKDNENFTVVSGFEFKDEKPVIAHVNLENRQWSNYSSYVIPQTDKLVTEADFMAMLGAEKAADQSEELSEAILNGKLKYGDGCLYSYKDNKITLYNFADLSVKHTYEFTLNVENVYIYDNILYYSEDGSYSSDNLYTINLITDERQTLFQFYDFEGVHYNGKYCWYSSLDSYRVINLENGYSTHFLKDGYEKVKFVDSAGNVYTGETNPKVYYGGKGEGVVLKGDGYLREWLDKKPVGNTVYTTEYPKAYRYENGVYKETINDYSYDPRIKGTYIPALGWYCYKENRTPLRLYDGDGKIKDAYTPVKMYADKQKFDSLKHLVCESVFAFGSVGDKVIVDMWYGSSANFAAIYSAGNFIKPVCYMNLNSDYYLDNPLKILNFGTKTVIAVKQADGTYSVWYG